MRNIKIYSGTYFLYLNKCFFNTIYMKKIILICFMSIVFLSLTKAQDTRFSQFYANKLYLNPALAGSESTARLSTSYRNQQPMLNRAYVSYSLSYDTYLESMSGGIGFLLLKDDEVHGLLKTINASAMYSYYLTVREKFVICSALQVSVIDKRLDSDKMRLPGQIDGFTGNVSGEAFYIDKRNNTKLDFSFGAVAYVGMFYAGIALNHLSEPNVNFQSDATKLDMKMTFHAGAEIMLTKDEYTKRKWSLAPALLFQQQGEFTQMNYGLYVNKGNIVGGIWFNQSFDFNYDSVIIMAGLVTDAFRVSYSYDYTVSELSQANSGAHEISVSVPLYFKRKKRFRAVASPRF